jgi:uncharacterized repeat protein (TIGR01451 family)
MRSMLTVLALMFALPGVAMADTVVTDFNTFNLGTVNGQGSATPQPPQVHCVALDCWKSAVPGNIPSLPNGYDQAVVTNTRAPAAFGSQSWRMSNAYNPAPDTFPPEYFYQSYSQPSTPPAGQDLANTEFVAQFSFISTTPDARQPGLKVDVSPDNGGGGRMSYIGLTDNPLGIAINFFDVPETNGAFVNYPLGTVERNVPHTIRFWIKLNPGPDNDRVAIFIDGAGQGRCFTTWENANSTVPVTDRLLFRSVGPQVTQSLVGKGYLFDNVTTTTANGPGPTNEDCSPEPPPVIDKSTQAQFVRPGGLVTYRLAVRNPGDVPTRAVRVCDSAPRALRFVRSSVRLRRAVGRRLCLVVRRLRPGQRKTFTATFRLRANTTATTVTNGGSVDIPIGSTPTPPEAGPPGENPVTPPTRRRVVNRDIVTIAVRRPTACPAAVARTAC